MLKQGYLAGTSVYVSTVHSEAFKKLTKHYKDLRESGRDEVKEKILMRKDLHEKFKV